MVVLQVKFLQFAIVSSRNTGGGASFLLELKAFPQCLSGNWIRLRALVMRFGSEKMTLF